MVSSSRPHLSTQKQRLTCVCAVILQVKWLALDFENWKDWEEDSDNDGENFDQFSDVSLFSFFFFSPTQLLVVHANICFFFFQKCLYTDNCMF